MRPMHEYWAERDVDSIALLFAEKFKRDPIDARRLLASLLKEVVDEDKRNLARAKVLNDDSLRIERVGEVLQKAGLRSYTDEQGRTYVAAPRKRRKRMRSVRP